MAISNRNRIDFLRTELELCFTFASIAETEHKTGSPEHAKRSVADAEKGYTTLQHFLSDPKHARHIRDDERRELTAGLERLRKILDGLART